MLIHQYESLAEYVAIAKPYCTNRYSDGTSWDDGVSSFEACERTLNGDPTLASKIDPKAYDFGAINVAEDIRATWQPKVAGSRVNVQAYLAGKPRCMRKRVKSEAEGKHVSIYVSNGASQGVRASQVLRRGQVVLGLLETLQSTGIGVDLYLVDFLGSYTGKDIVSCIRVESRPLDISTCGFAVAHPAFTRNVTFPAMRALYRFNGSWADCFEDNGGRTPEDGRFEAYARELFEMQASDIFVAPMFLYDPVVNRPEEWLKERVTQALI